jgi:hypothetical protein
VVFSEIDGQNSLFLVKKGILFIPGLLPKIPVGVPETV